MPWKRREPMDERISLIADWMNGRYGVTDLSEIYGVSRKTIYKWIDRYEEQGIEGLKEASRAAWSHPNQTKDEIVEELIKEKIEHCKWGPKKLLSHLQTIRPSEQWPSSCTIEKWLKRHGLVKERRRRRRVPPYSEPFLQCNAPNKVWSADFKGSSGWEMGDGAILLR